MATNKASVLVKSGARKAVAAFFEYDTPKIVHIKSMKVGIINRVIQATIIAYIIGYVIVWEKGYQETDPVVSVALTKVKGVWYTQMDSAMPGVSNRTWDVADYVVPPEESDAFFVMTNMIVTLNQTQGTCPEDLSMQGVICTHDDNCTAGQPVVNGNGVMTGKCVPTLQNTSLSNYSCEIYAWCDVEADVKEPDPALLEASKNFTVLIKNWIEFPKFEKKRRNIIDDIDNKTYLRSCRYQPDDPLDRFCPIFRLEDIARAADENHTYDELAVQGGVISIGIHWDCNLDFNIQNCVPVYSFRRLDQANASIAAGWNFRYANYYTKEDGTQTRDLYKAYGIRFVIKVTGQAGKFSVVPLLLNIGSGLGLLAIATVLCDIVVIYILKKGPFYQEKKYYFVTDEDAFRDLIESQSIGSRDDLPPAQSDPQIEMEDENDSERGSQGSINQCDGAAGQAEAGQVVKNRKPKHKPGDYERLED